MARLLTGKAVKLLFTYSDFKYTLSNCYSHFVGRGNATPILKVKWKSTPNRHYIGIAARIVRGVLKIRYLVLGGAVGGGMTLNKKYVEWRDGLPDMSWLNDVLPSSDKFNNFTKSLVDIKDTIKNTIDSDNAGGKILKELSEVQSKLTTRLENARLAANSGVGNFDDYDEENVIPSQSLQNKNLKKYVSLKSIMSLEDRDMHSLPDDVRAELITLKSKYRRRLLQIRRNVNSKMSLLYQDIQSELKKRPKVVNLNKKSSEDIELPQMRAPMLVVLGGNECESTSVVAALLGVDLFPSFREPESQQKKLGHASNLTSLDDDKVLSRRPIEIELLEGVDLIATICCDGEEKQYDLTNESQLNQCQRLLALLASERGNSEPIVVQMRGGYQQPLVVVLTPLQHQADRVHAQTYSREPHALILHLQDSQTQSPYDEIIKDIVKSSDPDRKRTILALTNLQHLVYNKKNLEKLNSFLDSDCLDTFFLAINSSEASSVNVMLKGEEKFFNTSRLVGNGTIKVSKSTFPSLRYQILEKTQKLFLQNVERQMNQLSIISDEQEFIWRRTYGSKTRPLDSEEVLKRAFDIILDKIANLKRVKLSEEGWCKVAESFLVEDMVDTILIKVINTGKGSVGLGESSLYGSVGTRALLNWIDSAAGRSAVSRAAHHALKHQLSLQQKSSKNQGPLSSVISETVSKISDVIVQSHEFQTTEKESEAVSILSHDILEESEILEENDWHKSVTLLEKSILRHQKVSIDNNESLFLKHALERLKTCKNGFIRHQLKDHHELELECPEVILFYKIQQIALVMSRSLRQQMLERHAEKVEKLARSAAVDHVPDPSSNSCLQMAEDIRHVRRLLQLLENLKKSLKPED